MNTIDAWFRDDGLFGEVHKSDPKLKPNSHLPGKTSGKSKPNERSADAGTSEGAVKAAATRKSHGGGAKADPGMGYPHSAATHQARANHLEERAAHFRGQGLHGVASEYEHVAGMHKKAAGMNLRTPAGRKFSEKTHATARANRLDYGRDARSVDAGTSEGAKKAAQTRKSHGGSAQVHPAIQARQAREANEAHQLGMKHGYQGLNNSPHETSAFREEPSTKSHREHLHKVYHEGRERGLLRRLAMSRKV